MLYGFLIQNSVEGDYQWLSDSAVLTFHDWHRNKGWDEFWNVAWAGISHQYLPIALQINHQVHYGWIELSVSKETGEFIIHDYGFHTVPDEAIEAGKKIEMCPLSQFISTG